MFAQIEPITPSIAREILANNNTRNARPLARDLVRRYATEMLEGRWKVSPQGLVFGADGELEDGQHRLAAIVQSGVTLPMWVTREAPPGVGDVLDQGRIRTAAQIASQALHSDVPASRLTSAARLVLEHGLGVSKPSNTAIVAYARRNAETLERYAPLARQYKAGTHAAFVFADLSGLENIQAAAKRLETGIWSTPQEEDPMRALDRSLGNLQGQGARAQRTMFFTTLATLEYVSRGEGLQVARKYDTMPGRVRTSIAASAPPPSQSLAPEAVGAMK